MNHMKKVICQKEGCFYQKQKKRIPRETLTANIQFLGQTLNGRTILLGEALPWESLDNWRRICIVKVWIFLLHFFSNHVLFLFV